MLLAVVGILTYMCDSNLQDNCCNGIYLALRVCLGSATTSGDARCCIYLCGKGIEALVMIPRLFFGFIISFVSHILKGFYLYNNLTPEEHDEGRDSNFMYVTRITIMVINCMVVIYLTIAFCCMLYVSVLGDAHHHHHRFSRIPFGSLVFNEGMSCPICLSNFRQSDRVV